MKEKKENDQKMKRWSPKNELLFLDEFKKLQKTILIFC